MKALCFLFILIAIASNLVAQTSKHCTIAQQKDFLEAYQDRSDRCEGLYTLKVSGGALSVVGFGQSLSGFNWEKIPEIGLSWRGPAGQAVRLRALSLQPRIPFRMDSARPADEEKFQWSTRILQRTKLSGSDLALAAWYEDRAAGAAASVYLPVMVSGQPAGTPLRVLLYPGATLTECRVWLRARDSQTNLLENSQPSKARYPEAVPIPIPLDAGLKPGIYTFDVKGKTANGGTATDSVLLRIP